MPAKSHSPRSGTTRRMTCMASFSRNDVILVRYPFSDLSTSKVRPAVVVGAPHTSVDAIIVPLTSRTHSHSDSGWKSLEPGAKLGPPIEMPATFWRWRTREKRKRWVPLPSWRRHQARGQPRRDRPLRLQHRPRPGPPARPSSHHPAPVRHRPRAANRQVSGPAFPAD